MTSEITATGNEIEIKVLGQEGDSKLLDVNVHWHVTQVLDHGLKALYGPQHPSADLYDVVVSGKMIEPLSMTVSEAGIVAGTTVSILPKTVTRG